GKRVVAKLESEGNWELLGKINDNAVKDKEGHRVYLSDEIRSTAGNAIRNRSTSAPSARDARADAGRIDRLGRKTSPGESRAPAHGSRLSRIS
ncbi:hypothetical protein HY988_02965, partial [Candidatus Micrarchaeota archaeon]|nr:hypothetical protein [Candidatus Micrarchaeota archaeon]